MKNKSISYLIDLSYDLIYLTTNRIPNEKIMNRIKSELFSLKYNENDLDLSLINVLSIIQHEINLFYNIHVTLIELDKTRKNYEL